MPEKLICILCPNGCQITYKKNENDLEIMEHGLCPKGDGFVKNEVFHPVRTICTSVRVLNGDLPLVSVRTDREIPKDKIFELMKLIKSLRIEAPVKINDIIYENALGLCNIKATKTINKIS